MFSSVACNSSSYSSIPQTNSRAFYFRSFWSIFHAYNVFDEMSALLFHLTTIQFNCRLILQLWLLSSPKGYFVLINPCIHWDAAALIHPLLLGYMGSDSFLHTVSWYIAFFFSLAFVNYLLLSSIALCFIYLFKCRPDQSPNAFLLPRMKLHFHLTYCPKSLSQHLSVI